MNSHLRLGAAALVLLAGLAGQAALLAAGQGPAPPPDRPPGQLEPVPQGPPPFAADLPPAEIQRLFDAYMLVQAQDALQLADERFGTFVARLKSLQETRRRFQQERQRRLLELQRLSSGRAPSDDQMLRERVRGLAEHDERAAAELRKAYDALDQVLDVRQQARFRVFEEQMERRKLELLMRARQANRPGDRRPGLAPPRD